MRIPENERQDLIKAGVVRRDTGDAMNEIRIKESESVYYLRNISTCCTVIAAYVVLRFLWIVWLALEAAAYMSE